MVKLTDNIEQTWPFISILHYGDNEYVGIIINQDSNVTSFYDYNLITTEDVKQRFLSLGETWWWESNRQIPISIFLRIEMTEFKTIIKHFTTKDVEIVLGPTVSLSGLSAKRVKRKSVQLVRRG